MIKHLQSSPIVCVPPEEGRRSGDPERCLSTEHAKETSGDTPGPNGYALALLACEELS